MDADRSPGDAEAAGAAAAMRELYGCELPAVGSRVSFRLRTHADNEYETGRVIRHITDDGRPIVVVEPEDEPGIMRALDAREWPAGNLLPF